MYQHLTLARTLGVETGWLFERCPSCVERFIRQHFGGWMLIEDENLQTSLQLSSIGIAIPLAEIYRGVTFPVAESPKA